MWVMCIRQLASSAETEHGPAAFLVHPLCLWGTHAACWRILCSVCSMLTLLYTGAADESLARSLQLDEDLSSAMHAQTPGSSQASHPQPSTGNPFSSFKAPSVAPPSSLPSPQNSSANEPGSGWNPFHAPAGGSQQAASSSGAGQKAAHPPMQKGPFTTSGRFSPPVSLPSSSSGKSSSSNARPNGPAAPASVAPKAVPGAFACTLTASVSATEHDKCGGATWQEGQWKWPAADCVTWHERIWKWSAAQCATWQERT